MKERVAHGFRGVGTDRFSALRGVDFEVARGEFFGIVGRNGSGKSTLLKVIAGIYAPDRGRVEVAGRLSPFIEMGVGFNPELTGRENVMLNGAILGLSRRQLRARFDDIVAFAELESFVDLKLKNYSAGMNVRLGFSMAIQVDADVLLVDEVLAVGDASFEHKCFAQFERLKDEGRTVLFVTHDMDQVERLCDRAMLLEEGRVGGVGPPQDIAERYQEQNRHETERRSHAAAARAAAVRGPSAPQERAAPFVTAGKPASYRPSALGDDLWQLLRLSFTIAGSEIRLHYQDSVLGYLWSVTRPLALFAVLYLIFSRATNLGAGVENYPVYLICAVVLWTFFAEVSGGGVVSLASNRALLRRMRFPRLAIPLAVILKGFFNLAMNFVAVVVLLAVVGVSPRLAWLELPVLIVLLGLLTAGVAMILSTLYVRFRDLQQLWTVLLQLLFFGSPIIYVASRYPESIQQVFAYSPLTAIFTQMRHALVDPSAPTAADALGGEALLLVPLAIVLGVFAFGAWLFARDAPRIAERL